MKREGGAGKTKYVPLLSTEGESQLSIKFPGRFFCQCLGQKHELINNCLECGRIVCSQVSFNDKYMCSVHVHLGSTSILHSNTR